MLNNIVVDVHLAFWHASQVKYLAKNQMRQENLLPAVKLEGTVEPERDKCEAMTVESFLETWQ